MNNKPRRLAPFIGRAIFFLGGSGIIYHEVVISDTAEPLLIFVGLWLAGAPIADFLDKLRRLAQLQEPPEPPPEPQPESE